MAAKRRGSKKKVTVEIDIETLEKLLEAASALSDAANAFVLGSDDPNVRSLKKKTKGGRKR